MELAQKRASLILVARREDRLRRLAESCHRLGAAVAEPLVADISSQQGAHDLLGKLTSRPRHIDILINCAGVGEYGQFKDQAIDDLEQMIHLNVMSLVALTRGVLPDMVRRGEGWILNVASTGAFQPTPYMAVYGATKSFVLNFTAAIAQELHGTGVQISCLCPGPVRTEFFNRGGYQERAADFQRVASSATFVARKGIKGLIDGKRVVIPGMINKVGAFAVRLAPIKTVARVSAKILGPKSAR